MYVFLDQRFTNHVQVASVPTVSSHFDTPFTQQDAPQCEPAFVTLFMLLIHCVVAQSVTCLATDACLTADPGVAISIPARSHTFVEIDHEIISTVILLPSADLFKKGCCQLQAKVCAQITG